MDLRCCGSVPETFLVFSLVIQKHPGRTIGRTPVPIPSRDTSTPVRVHQVSTNFPIVAW